MHPDLQSLYNFYKSNEKINKEYQKKYYSKNKQYMNTRNEKDRKKYRNTNKGKFTSYTSNAKTRGIEFFLTIDQFSEIIKKPCNYCGEEGYGIDRIDSSIGYIIENCVSCCTICNGMKLDYTVKEFLDQCKKIVIKNNL